MRPFSNISCNFAANLHLLVDSIRRQGRQDFSSFWTKMFGKVKKNA